MLGKNVSTLDPLQANDISFRAKIGHFNINAFLDNVTITGLSAFEAREVKSDFDVSVH